MAVFKFQAPIKRVKPTQQNPRAIVTGTKLEAQGHAAPTQLNTSEQGSSYAPPNTGPPVELVPQLTSAYQRSVTFAQMMNDMSVDVSVRAWKTPVLGAEYFVDPYGDDPLDAEVAQFVDNNLFGGMDQPFLLSLQDILHLCEDGYAVLEKVYENREWTPPIDASNNSKAGSQFRNTKVFTMLKALSFRPPTTLGDITYDNNGYLSQIIQNAIQGDQTTKEVKLTPDKLVVFTLNKKGGDITGKSLLRTAYPHWFYKGHFYKLDAIQKERHGIGVPRGKLLPGYTNADKEALRAALRNLRTNEESFIIQTPNVEIDFAELKGQLVNILESAEHHNSMVLLNVMAAFMGLGVNTQGGGGSRAVGSTQADMFMKSLKFIAQYICEVINQSVIPELVTYNYKTTNFPQLRVRNIGETQDLQRLGSGLASMIAQGGITMDLPTEQYFRKLFDIPAKQEGIENYPPPSKENINVQGNSPDTASGNGHSTDTQLVGAGTGSQKGDTGRSTNNPSDGGGNNGKPAIGNGP